jgi:hypothetical protein
MNGKTRTATLKRAGFIRAGSRGHHDGQLRDLC